MLLLTAAYTDLSSFKIPNWISLALLAAFIPAALFSGLGIVQIGAHLLVGFVALIIGAALFFLRVWGGGDAKLIAAVSVWIGAAGVSQLILGIAMFGGLLAIFLIIGRRMRIQSSTQWVANLFSPKKGAPYGVAIALGGLWAANTSPVLISGLQAIGV